MTKPELPDEQRERLCDALREAARLLHDAAEADNFTNESSVLHRATTALRPVLEALWTGRAEPADLHEDAVALWRASLHIAGTVLEPEAFEEARARPHDLEEVVLRAFVACVNLRGFEDPSWPRVSSRHLTQGYELIAAGEYVLFGTKQFGAAVPADIKRFPRIPPRTTDASMVE